MSGAWPIWIVSARVAEEQQQKAMLDSISRMDFSWPETVDTRVITVPTLCAETEGTQP